MYLFGSKAEESHQTKSMNLMNRVSPMFHLVIGKRYKALIYRHIIKKQRVPSGPQKAPGYPGAFFHYSQPYYPFFHLIDYKNVRILPI